MRITSWKEFKTMQLMKKIILSSMLFAAAAMAFVSCQKSETTPTPESKLVTLKFTSANPTTKTEYNGETIVWSAGDQIRMACTANGIWQDQNGDVAEGGEAALYLSKALETEPSEKASFVIADHYMTERTGPYQFYTISSRYAVAAKFIAPNAEITIPTTQTSTANTFDKNADVLWGKAVKTYDTLPKEAVIPLLWTRLVAHANITLKNINGIADGEGIKKITLTANEGANMVGKFNLEMTTGAVTANTPLNGMTVLCEGINADAEGNVSFWACINPCEWTSIDVTVSTDAATYTISKTGFSREFLQNRRNLLDIDMSTATRTVSSSEFSLITNTNQIVAGEYAIVAESNGEYYAGSLLNGSKVDCVKLSVANGEPILTAATPVFNIALNDKNYISLLMSNGKYLSKLNGSKTAMTAETDPSYWIVKECSSTGLCVLEAELGNGRNLRLDNATNQLVAATSGAVETQYKKVMLFKKN